MTIFVILSMVISYTIVLYEYLFDNGLSLEYKKLLLIISISMMPVYIFILEMLERRNKHIIETIKKISIKENDYLIISLPENISIKDLERIQNIFNDAIPKHHLNKIILMIGDIKIYMAEFDEN